MDLFKPQDDVPETKLRFLARPPSFRPFIVLAILLVAGWVVLQFLPPPKHHATLAVHEVTIDQTPTAPHP